MTDQTFFHWGRDPDGIVTLTMDALGQTANTMSRAFVDAFGVVVDRLEAERDNVSGVILTSAKKTFFAGGDLKELITSRPEEAAEIQALSMRTKGALRRLRRSASRLLRRLTAPLLAVAWRLRWPVTTGSRWALRIRRSGCPKSRSVCYPGRAVSCALCVSWVSPMRCRRCCYRGSGTTRARRSASAS